MDEPEEHIHVQVLLPALGVSLLLVLSIYTIFQFSKPRTGHIILPGGVTYLGPSPSPTGLPTVTSVKVGTPAKQLNVDKIPLPADVTWTETKGKIYPYTFSYPSSLSLGVFPDDPYDGVTVFYGNTDSSANLFFRVEDLNRLNKKDYIAKPKMDYVSAWWKDYQWKGVASVTAFTNSKGLHGYRAKYLDDTGKTPYDQVFFEIPEKNDRIIWLSGKLFDQNVFDKIVDRVSWN